MSAILSRRELIAGTGGAGVVAALIHGLPLAAALEDPAASDTETGGVGGEPWPGYPRQDARLVKEIVGAAHRNEERVRELLDLRPALANAWWDWSFGDWESPLGAAAHTGRRSIAELLIERGARVDIFAAAMLGYTDVVKAFIAASPGVQRTPGPHGIPLLAHAEAGGEAAAATAAYLESLGDAGIKAETRTVSEEQAGAYVGRYRFGAAEGAVFEVKLDQRGKLTIVRTPEAVKPLNCVGEHEFFPVGVPSVRIRFDVSGGRATGLSVVEKDLTVTAARLP